jgi:hypothetical protein
VYTNNIPTGRIVVRVSYEYLPNVIHTYINVLPQQACIISLQEVTESRHDTFQSRLLTFFVTFLSLVDMLHATGGGFGT